MIITVFDTETTDLPKYRNPPHAEMESWPHIVQLSYITYDTTTRIVKAAVDQIIRIDDSVVLSEDSVAIHGITRRRSIVEGIEMSAALKTFTEWVAASDCTVAHNIQFDKDMLTVEALRCGGVNPFTVPDGEPRGPTGKNRPEYCTMKKSKDITRIERINQTTGRTYFKFPTLTELHVELFGSVPMGVHNAIVDVLVCLRCYMRVRQNVDDILVVDPGLLIIWNRYITQNDVSGPTCV